MLVDPSLALQAAIKSRLLTDPTISAEIVAASIRGGSIRDEDMPAVILTPAQVEILGHGAGGQIIADLRMMLHLWTAEDDAPRAQRLATAIMMALTDAPRAEGCDIDAWERPSLVWFSDPNPARSYTHAAIQVNAALRWRVA